MLKKLLTIRLLPGKNPYGLLTVLLLGITLCGYSQQYDLREYPDGLAQPYVYSIIQDNDGYLWIGTGNGLSKYNGFTFKSFTVNDSLADNFITCSIRKGSDLWFGHMNGDVSHYNGKVFNRIIIASDQKTGITDIEISPDGTIWAGTYANGLVNLYAESTRKQPTVENNHLAIFSFKFISENELLIGSGNGLKHCRLLKSGEVEVIQHIGEIPESKIPDIIKMKDGLGYYVATETDGVFSVTPVEGTFKVTRVSSGYNFEPGIIQSIFEDSKSNLWISTFGNGLIKLSYSPSGQTGETIVFNKSTGYSTDNVKTVFEDREGNIWTGNYGTGLTQMTRKAFSFYSFGEIRHGVAIYSIVSDNKYIWLGTDKGLFKLDKSTEKELALYSAESGLPTDKITAIYSDQGKEIWIGTENRGVFRLKVENGKVTQYRIGEGILENSITAITGRDGEVWAGTKKGVCYIKPASGEIQWYTLEKGGLPHNYVNHLFIDSKGKIWISTLGNTLAFIENGQVGKVMIKSEKGVLSLGAIVEDNDSIIWVGSYGGGIFRIKSDSIANITSKEGLFSDYCYSLLADNKGILWVGHQGGLSKIRTTDLLVKSLQQYIGIDNSCQFSKNAILKDNRERVWFGTDQGLWIYDPALENQVLLPPVLNITSFKVNDVEINYKDKLVLSPGKYKVRIDFLGINLTEPANVNYKYQLAGYDPAPENTKSRSIVYPSLDDGRYTFILWSSTGDGVMTETPLTINFKIKTSVWEEWWFYIFVFMALIFVVSAYIKRREYRYHKEKEILETRVKDRTSELAQKNALLNEKQKQISEQNIELQKYHNYLEDLVEERTRELLKAKNKAEESDRLKTAFLQNMSHEIRTPMNGILGFLTLLKEPEIDATEKNSFMEIIDQSGQRLLNTINDIIEISKIESGQVAVHYSEVNIKEVLDYHLKFFEQPAKEKGLALNLSAGIDNKDSVIVTDRNILDNILTNLINNAIKFTHTGSVEFGCYLLDGEIVYFVKDTGIGIPANRLEAIFDRFVQADTNLNRTYEGSGLGLSIVKEYLKILNGKIWVESEEGKGSTFFFSFRPKPEENKAKNNRHYIESGSFKGENLTVLVAEDDDVSYRFIENILVSLAINVLHTSTGAETVKLIHEIPDISMVLMDIKMLELNDYDVVRQIRHFNSTVPLIAQTSFEMFLDKDKALAAGCTDYVIKPMRNEKIIHLIQQYT